MEEGGKRELRGEGVNEGRGLGGGGLGNSHYNEFLELVTMFPVSV